MCVWVSLMWRQPGKDSDYQAYRNFDLDLGFPYPLSHVKILIIATIFIKIPEKTNQIFSSIIVIATTTGEEKTLSYSPLPDLQTRYSDLKTRFSDLKVIISLSSSLLKEKTYQATTLGLALTGGARHLRRRLETHALDLIFSSSRCSS